MKIEDPCKKCPLLNGKDLGYSATTPCQDNNGFFLGVILVSPMACETVIRNRVKQEAR